MQIRYREFVLCIAAFTSCNATEEIQLDYCGIHPDTLENWLEFALSSDEGLWEGDESKGIQVIRIETYGGEQDFAPAFYNADFISTYGDTIYISDGSQEALVAMSSAGELLWETGQLGEGPGDFAHIGSTSRYGDVIAVCNNSLCRVDFFSINGVFESSVSVSGPQNVLMISDSIGLVASKSQAGGNIHLFNRYTGIERSFGESEWEMFPNNYPGRDLFIVYHPMGRVACVSQFEDNLFIYDMETGETINSGTRQLPTMPSNGTIQTFYTVYATVFLGPDSMINIPIPNIMDNAKFMGSGGTRHSLVTIVDRYNWDGIYLDSYLLPDSMLEGVVYSSSLGFIAAQWGTSEIHRYNHER